jgi:hypothetical protein
MVNLCIGFYVGEGDVHEPLDIAGCWARAKGETNAWIAKDKNFEADGLSGDLNNLVGMEQRWTATAADFLDIKDKGNVATIEADILKLEEANPDCDSADEAEKKLVSFF